jgi:hypothetical protein
MYDKTLILASLQTFNGKIEMLSAGCIFPPLYAANLLKRKELEPATRTLKESYHEIWRYAFLVSFDLKLLPLTERVRLLLQFYIRVEFSDLCVSE